MAFIGSKAGVSSASTRVIGQKSNNSHGVIGSKGGAFLAGRQTVVSTRSGKGIGDMGGGRYAPGNTTNSVSSGQRDAAERPEGVKSMADPRPSKRMKTTESNKRNKAN